VNPIHHLSPPREFNTECANQDLGAEFHFEPDQDALQSILNNQGVERSNLARLSPLTPAKHIPGSFKKDADKLEFFESAGGKVFFRRKVVNTPRNDRSNVKRFKNNPAANKFAPMRMGPISAQKNLGRSPLSLKSINTPNVMTSHKFATEKKPKIDYATHRQSISEKKPFTTRSLLPKPSCGSRKSLYFSQPQPVLKQKNESVEKSTGKLDSSFDFVKPAAVEFPLQPLTALTRDSLRLLPRESRAWLEKLPRDSVTFREIEKLMNVEDRNCVNDDDTCAFERMEHRIEPKEVKLAQIVTEKMVSETSDDVFEDGGGLDSDNESNCSFEAREIELKTPKATRTKQFTNVNENKENLVNDFENLALNDDERQTTPKVIINELPKKYKKKHEMFGTKTNESPKAKESLNAPLLVKSLSMIDLNQSEDFPLTTLATSSSVENLHQDLEISGLVSLDQMENILSDLDKYRAEQDALEIQKLEIFRKIQQRRDDFKAAWGVSPKSVNKIRTVIPEKKAPLLHQFLSPICESPITPNVESVCSVTSSAIPASVKTVPNLSSATPPSSKPVPNMSSATPPAPNTLGATPTSSKPARSVRVRFNSGANVAKTPSPIQFEASPYALDASPLPESTSARNSFSALRSSFSFLQTPKAAQHPKKRMVEEFEVTNSGKKQETKKSVPTPVALRSLSDRVHAELAKLYADSEDECEETQAVNLMKKLTYE